MTEASLRAGANMIQAGRRMFGLSKADFSSRGRVGGGRRSNSDAAEGAALRSRSVGNTIRVNDTVYSIRETKACMWLPGSVCGGEVDHEKFECLSGSKGRGERVENEGRERALSAKLP
jgi:hypothetical protein